MKSASQTPAPKSERVYGSSKNAIGSAASKSSAASIQLSQAIVKTLEDKREEFNKKYPTKKVSLAILKAVMRRGMGAYSISHRPTITGGKPNSRQAWGFARVNKFLEKKAGKPVKKAYVQDDDLLENGGVLGQDEVFLNCENKKWYRKYRGDDPLYYDKEASKKYGNGIYFLNKSNSRFDGDKEIEVIIDYKNPKIYHNTKTIPNLNFIKDWRKNYGENEMNKFVDELFDNGYDAIIVEHGDNFGDELIIRDKSLITNNKMEKGGITGDLHSLTNQLLAQKIEIFIKKVQPIKFYYIDEDSNSLIIGLDENYTTGVAEKLHKEATSSAEFFDADSINMEYNQNTRQAQYSIKLKKVAKFGKGGLLAPNGNKSNLTLEQYKLVRTPEFKAWFGDWEKDPQNASKVLDENGEPLVVYHGTYAKEKFNTFDFNKADLGFHFGTYEQAKDRSQTKLAIKDFKQFIDPFFLNIKKLFVINDAIEFEYPQSYINDLLERNIISEKEINENRLKGLTTKHSNQIIRNLLVKKYGNVGFKYDNKIESNGYSYIVCELNQIKLADGSNTTFDSKNPDKRYADGGEMPNQIALPDTYASYESLKPILKNQGYELNKINMDIPVGKLAKGKNLSQVAAMHGMKAEDLIKELALGVKTETEHTFDLRIARSIALDHLVEDPEYYTNLLKMETNMEADKLENYYKNGGELAGISCQILDKNGERDISPEAIKTLTECVMSLPQTKTIHFDYESNDYKPYRKRLHKDIIYELKKDLICVENDKPIAILMGGSPASGKSTFLKKYAPYLLKEEIFKIDADEIRAKLPEYKGFNAAQTHMETKDIVATLLSDRNIGMPCTFDVIYDGTMNNTKSYIPLIYLLKSLGYKVFIVYIDRVPKDVVVNRSLERYKKQGRFVPLEVIDDFFGKGKEALEQLKLEVDGYIIVDGSNTTYEVIEKGGQKIPQDRNYSKIGEPIKITSSEVIREFKKGGQIDPDNSQIKDAITHKSGEAGGLLVGKRHSEGGIKAINKSTNQPLEMEGGEVVITRDAVSDNEKREFEGEMLTNRQILSRINESGGGVSFADGGDVPEKCACSGKSYNYGGKLMADNEIIESIMGAYKKATDFDADELIEPSELNKKLFAHQYLKDGGMIYEEGGIIAIANKQVPSLPEFSKKNPNIIPIGMKKAYSDYLKRVYKFDFNELPHMIQAGLIVGSQKLVDKYINS